MSKTIRIRTTPNGDDKFIKINMEQDFDFVEILSLKISQKDLYTTFCAGYGAIVGRVSVNGGFGVPNAKVSVFIPVSDLDRENDKIFGLYPFETISDKGPNGLRYNLLSKENQTNDDCFTPVGDFPDKRTFLDDDTMLDIYCEYYKFTTTTNAAGDYMIFGVPTGAQIMHAEADVSDIGIISQKPFDFIRKGASEEIFESTTKFRDSDEDLDFNTQIISRSPIGVNVQPYWGDEDTCNVAITRRDIDLKAAITPQAIFMGSIFGDNEESSLSLRCKPRENMGVLDGQTAGTGRIEMVRKTIAGNIERFDVGGAQLIDSDGAWAYQVPMNLDYRVTDEFGNLVPTDDPKKGIPTRAKVRFRIKMDITGGEGNLRERAAYLVPNNPLKKGGLNTDFEFGPNTNDESLAELVWNGIYTVKNYIPRYQKSTRPNLEPTIRNFVGIKDVDSARGKYTPFPYNHLNFETEALFGFICTLTLILTTLIIFINLTILTPINVLISTLNDVLDFFGIPLIPYIPCITIKCNNVPYAPGCCSSNSGQFPCTAPRADLGCGAVEDPSVVCVGLTSDNDVNQTLPPADAGFMACTAASLAQELELFQFDFYNDWVNGALYSPLFKLRVKDGGTGKERFCEWSSGGSPTDLSVDNDIDGNFDNDNYNDIDLVDSCYGIPLGCSNATEDFCGNFDLCEVPAVNRKGHRYNYNVALNHGLIVKSRDGYFYYAPYARTKDEYLLATDIVTLGSSVKCHWLGLPSVYDLFVDTTYKLPPYVAETDPNNSSIVITSGMDTARANLGSNPCNIGNVGLDSLFFDVNCFFTRTDSQTCGNLRRQCELGVGFDEVRPNSNPDNLLTQDDIDVEFTRNVFAWMNGVDLNGTRLNSIYQTPFDVDANFDNLPYCGNQYGTDDYNRFRYGWIDNNNTGTMCDGFPQSVNSFYFYFGLNRNKTALSKMLSKYFAPCPIKDKPDFLIIGDTTDSTVLCNNGAGNGEINVSIQGGTPPYTYFWTYPDNTQVTITGNTKPLLDDPDLEDLCGGSYILTVIDSNGLSSTITFIVGEPQPVSCLTEAIPTTNQGANDGIINVFINGGVGPYTMDISPDPNNVYPQSNLSAGQQVINNLPVGSYTIDIEDSEGGTTQCIAEITEPEGLIVLINHLYDIGSVNDPNDPNDPDYYNYDDNSQPSQNADVETFLLCNGDTNGTIRALVFGGVPPYNATISPNPNNITVITTTSPVPTFIFTPLEAGTYTIEVDDNAGNVIQTVVLVSQPPVFEVGDIGSFIAPTITPTTIGVTVAPFNSGEDITYYLYDSNGQLIQEVTVQQGTYEFSGLTANTTYQIAARNENGCLSDTIELTTSS
jgi:hypothetical protein